MILGSIAIFISFDSGLLPMLNQAAAQNAADELLNSLGDEKHSAKDSTKDSVTQSNGSSKLETKAQSQPDDEKSNVAVESNMAAEESSDESGDSSSSDSSEGWLNQLDEITQSGALGILRRGGFFMWPILLMGIIGLGVIIERYRSLKMLSSDAFSLRTDVQKLVSENKIDEAYQLCDSSEGPIPAILAAGLRKYLVLGKLNQHPAQIQQQVNKAMEDYSVHIFAGLERHLPILATIASVAPMLGFLGTVVGMVEAFDTIKENFGEMNIVEAAAGGIGVSLLTTAFGLIVGILTYTTYNYFMSIINSRVLEVEESANELIDNFTLQLALESE